MQERAFLFSTANHPVAEPQGVSGKRLTGKAKGCMLSCHTPHLISAKPVAYKLGLISFHFSIGGTILRVTSSSRILQRCW